MSFLEILPIALLGAVCGLDFVSFPQAMISRPIVGATAGGAILGSPTEGLLIGVVLELLALDTRPFGASRYPEWGTAGVTGGAVFASAGACDRIITTASILARSSVMILSPALSCSASTRCACACL